MKSSSAVNFHGRFRQKGFLTVSFPVKNSFNSGTTEWVFTKIFPHLPYYILNWESKHEINGT